MSRELYTLQNTRFTRVNHSMYKRTKNMHIKAVTKLYENSVVFVHDEVPLNNNRYCKIGVICKNPVKTQNESTRWEWRCCYGLMIQIFDEISKNLDFTYELYIVEDDQFGRFEENKWNGLINDLISNKADVAVHHLIGTKTRSQFVEFGPGMVETRYVVIRRRTNYQISDILNWDFTKRVHISLVAALLLSIVIVFTIISLFENHPCTPSVTRAYRLREVLSYLGGLVTQRDLGGKNPLYWSARLVALCFAMATTIIMNTYTAVIAASNINMVVDSSFQGLMDEKVRM